MKNFGGWSTEFLAHRRLYWLKKCRPTPQTLNFSFFEAIFGKIYQGGPKETQKLFQMVQKWFCTNFWGPRWQEPDPVVSSLYKNFAAMPKKSLQNQFFAILNKFKKKFFFGWEKNSLWSSPLTNFFAKKFFFLQNQKFSANLERKMLLTLEISHFPLAQGSSKGKKNIFHWKLFQMVKNWFCADFLGLERRVFSQWSLPRVENLAVQPPKIAISSFWAKFWRKLQFSPVKIQFAPPQNIPSQKIFIFRSLNSLSINLNKIK